jgi:hypothetical protein
MFKPCKHCGYQRKRQLVKGSGCPRCGWKPVSLTYKLRRILHGLKRKPYTPRHKYRKDNPTDENLMQEAREVVNEQMKEGYIAQMETL